ncbi:MAG: YpdA family putative bacillithiol disulfide reductase [Gemmatimonadota bacterium]|nr:YpdA family putative bacillithiol disulfide reductase [Gemmatimonadota bacterium]
MTDPRHHPAIIVGAGPIGLACAISARRNGIDPLVVDQGAIAESIVKYPIGMTFFTTPERLEIGGHPMTCAGAKTTREEALMYFRGVVRAEQLNVRTYTRLESAAPKDGRLHCQLASQRGAEIVTTDRLVIATGYFDHPNLLDVPGESLPHVSHWFDEAHRTAGQDVVIVGGKNSAIESALQCYRAGARVSLVYRRPELKPSVKFWLRPDFENRVKAGEIRAYLGCEVTAITDHSVEVRDATGLAQSIPADRVYVLTGYHPDFSLLRQLGIELTGPEERPTHNPETLETNVPGIHLAGSVTAGRAISEIFIENGRFDGDKIFGDSTQRARADARYAAHPRPVGE